MTDLRKAAEMSLETLERLDKWLSLRYGNELTPPEREVVKALRLALAQPEQEDGFDVYQRGFEAGKALAQPKQKHEWVGLTNVEIQEIRERFSDRLGCNAFVEAVSYKLKEKNT